LTNTALWGVLFAMSGKYFYTVKGARQGPTTLNELKSLAAREGLKRSDLVWSEGMAAWQPAGATAEIFQGLPPDLESATRPSEPPPLPSEAQVGRSVSTASDNQSTSPKSIFGDFMKGFRGGFKWEPNIQRTNEHGNAMPKQISDLHGALICLSLGAALITWIHMEIPHIVSMASFFDHGYVKTLLQVARAGCFGGLALVAFGFDEKEPFKYDNYFGKAPWFLRMLWICILTTGVVFSIKFMFHIWVNDLFVARAAGAIGFFLASALWLYIIACIGVSAGSDKYNSEKSPLRVFNIVRMSLIAFAGFEGALIVWHIAKPLIK